MTVEDGLGAFDSLMCRAGHVGQAPVMDLTDQQPGIFISDCPDRSLRRGLCSGLHIPSEAGFVYVSYIHRYAERGQTEAAHSAFYLHFTPPHF